MAAEKMSKNVVLTWDSNLHLPESKKMSENQTKALPLSHRGITQIRTKRCFKIFKQKNLHNKCGTCINVTISNKQIIETKKKQHIGPNFTDSEI